MKEFSFENVLIAIGIAIFGAVVNVVNNIAKARKAAHDLTAMDKFTYIVTSLFSGLVFGLLAILLGEFLEIEITVTQLWLSVAVGTVMGWDGLTKLASRSLDAVIYTLKK